MRTPDERRIAERACLDGIHSIETRRSVRVDGRIMWTPTQGMSADVKVFKVVEGRVDPTPAAREITDNVMQEIQSLCVQHHCALMPVLIVVGDKATVEIVTIGLEKLEQPPDDQPHLNAAVGEDTPSEDPS